MNLFVEELDDKTNETKIIFEELKMQLDKANLTKEALDIAKKIPTMVKIHFKMVFIQIFKGKVKIQ
jgi:hypothetical protein